MEILEVDNKKYPVIRKDENCPVCDCPMKEVYWSWNMFHGEAESSCCGVSYQIKDYYVKNQSEQMKAFLSKLGKDFYWLKVKTEYIEPLNRALKKLGVTRINNETVNLATEYLNPTKV